MIGRLALGTVQFGLDYGISNVSGQVPLSEIQQILDYCRQVGIDTLDTAYAYGQSEQRLGEAGVAGFRIVSKIPASCTSIGDARRTLDESLRRLGTTDLYGLLYHDYNTYSGGHLDWEELLSLQQEYSIERVGFSFYHPHQWQELRERDIYPQLVQLPYNLFDRRFAPLFATAAEENTEIHVRSAFLQGLFFRDPDTLPPYFAPVADRLRSLRAVANDDAATIAALCLRFVLADDRIDRVVIGTESKSQLEANVTAIGDTDTIPAIPDELLAELAIDDLSILNPSRWK